MVAGFVAGYQQSGGDYEAALRLGNRLRQRHRVQPGSGDEGG